MTKGQLEAPFLSRNRRIVDLCSALLLVDVSFFNERQCCRMSSPLTLLAPIVMYQ